MKRPVLIVAILASVCIAGISLAVSGNELQDPTQETVVAPDTEAALKALRGSTEDLSSSKLQDNLSEESEPVTREPVEPELKLATPEEEITLEDRVEYVRQRAYSLARKVEDQLKKKRGDEDFEFDLESCFDEEDIRWLEDLPRDTGIEDLRLRSDVFWHLVKDGNASQLRGLLYAITRVAENEILDPDEPKHYYPSFFVNHMTMDEDPLKPFR